MRPHLLADTFLKAMNCVYLIEDINALVMDENRQITAVERHDIHAQLSILENLLAAK